MKKMMLLLAAIGMMTVASAKDLKTLVLTTTTQKMHCQNCENKIKNQLRFEKGVKQIETSVEKQTITITYDADKNTAEKLVKSLDKIGYKVKVKSNQPSKKD